MTIDSITVDPEAIKAFIAGTPAVQEEGQEVPPPETSAEGQTDEKSKKSVTFKGEGAKAKESKKQDKKAKDAETLKNILTKMVPYINIPYAEHVLKDIGADPNAKANERDINTLI